MLRVERSYAMTFRTKIIKKVKTLKLSLFKAKAELLLSRNSAFYFNVKVMIQKFEVEVTIKPLLLTISRQTSIR